MLDFSKYNVGSIYSNSINFKSDRVIISEATVFNMMESQGIRKTSKNIQSCKNQLIEWFTSYYSEFKVASLDRHIEMNR